MDKGTADWAKYHAGEGDKPAGYNGEGGGGTSSYDNLLQTLPKATDYAGTLNANENNAVNDYFGYLKSQDSPLAFYTKTADAAGIPAMKKTQSTLQGQIYDLEDTLRRIEPNVTATTGQSLVTEAQRQGMVAEKQKPIVQDLGWLGQSLGRVSGAISDANNQALQLTNLQQQGVTRFADAYKTKLDVAMQQGTRGLQAFIHDTDQTLNVTLAKIARQEKISDTEAAQAFELMKLQKQAEYSMQQQSSQQSFAASQPNTEIVEVGGRKVLIDKNTGKTIQDLGSSKTVSSGTVGGYTSAFGATPSVTKTTTSSPPPAPVFGMDFSSSTNAGSSASFNWSQYGL